MGKKISLAEIVEAHPEAALALSVAGVATVWVFAVLETLTNTVFATTMITLFGAYVAVRAIGTIREDDD